MLQRVYELGDLPRVSDMLAEPRGTLRACFAFARLSSGRPGAQVTVAATPQLVCQRCLQGFGWPVACGSEIEFATVDEQGAVETERELFAVRNGRLSLRELAEEELLLALPLAPACSTPLTCGKAAGNAMGEADSSETGEMRRPFGSWQDLLK